MALLVGGPQGVDLSILDVAALLEGVILIRTSTVFSLDAGGGNTITFTGAGFQYDSSGEPVGGVIAGISTIHEGETVFELSGVSIPVSSFVHWVETGETAEFLETVFAGNDTLDAGNLQGSFLFGLDGNDMIFGSPSEDVILGGDGSDTLLAGQGDDVILAGAGADAVQGNRGDDIIVGGSGDDYIHGGQGSDIIAAGSGDDLLYGDRGDDRLIGGPGADEFYFLAGGGSDLVMDFNPAEGDRLELEPGATFTVSVVGLNTVVDLGGGDQFTLLGVQTTSLPSSWLG